MQQATLLEVSVACHGCLHSTWAWSGQRQQCNVEQAVWIEGVHSLTVDALIVLERGVVKTIFLILLPSPSLHFLLFNTSKSRCDVS